MRTLTITLLLILTTSLITQLGAAGSSPQPELVFRGLAFPVALAFAPDGRMFFNEKNTGNIRVVQGGTVLPTPFATLSVTNNGEQGLLGIALDPDFATNGFLYVYYTYSDGTFYHGRIARFTAQGNVGGDPRAIFDVTDPSSQSTNHNGGYLKFGPEGKLYVEVGEFANSQSSQDLSTYAGKILRMNPDGSAPADNPFPGSLVYAYGIRNAFGMAFDPNTHMLIETEAGPGTDEINIIRAGANYGWPICEGVCNNPAYEDPIVTFSPATTPTGIAYASPRTFYFGEWNTGAMKRLQLTTEGRLLSVDQVFSVSNLGAGIIAVERGPDGEIYFSTPTSIFRYRPSAPQTFTTTTEAIQEFDSSHTIMIVAIVLFAVVAAWLLYRTRTK